jgi:hypothetical protein
MIYRYKDIYIKMKDYDERIMIICLSNNFKTTEDINDKLHISEIDRILFKNFNYKKIDTRIWFNRLQIGKFNSKTNINDIEKFGYEYVKYVGVKPPPSQ